MDENINKGNIENFNIDSIKATQEAYLKYKERENNKLMQILNITTVSIVGLIAIAKDNAIAGFCLTISLLCVFLAYICFYYYDYHNANVNAYSTTQSYAKTYNVMLNPDISIVLEEQRILFGQYSNKCKICIGISFLFIIISALQLFGFLNIIYKFINYIFYKCT